METLRKLKIWLVSRKYLKYLKIVLISLISAIVGYTILVVYLFPYIYMLHVVLCKILFYAFFISLFMLVLIYLINKYAKYLYYNRLAISIPASITLIIFLFPVCNVGGPVCLMLLYCSFAFFIIVLFLSINRDGIDNLENTKKYDQNMQQRKSNKIFSDSPAYEDVLNRGNVIDRLIDVIDTAPIEGQKIILSAGWGDGKTSCLNFLKKDLNDKKQNQYEFIEISPWFNDTKTQFVETLSGKLDSFVVNNPPFVSMSKYLKKYIKLSSVDIKFFHFDICPNMESVEESIKNIGNTLRLYKKRIIISIDDLDRLPKDNILFVLQTVQMFSEYTNIIFLLSFDSDRVEKILCEESDSCGNDGKRILTKSYYKGYIEKMATIIIKLPKIREEDVYDFVRKNTNNILKEIEVKNTVDWSNDGLKKFYCFSRFSNLRDAKRFLNCFYVSLCQAKDFVDIRDFFNFTVLYCFFPDIYNEIWNERHSWFKIYDALSQTGIEKKRKYFQQILARYPEEQYALNNLLSLISPLYNTYMGELHKNVSYNQESHVGSDGKINNENFRRYFTHKKIEIK